jgi:hypothetical protein
MTALDFLFTAGPAPGFMYPQLLILHPPGRAIRKPGHAVLLEFVEHLRPEGEGPAPLLLWTWKHGKTRSEPAFGFGMVHRES